MNCLSLFQIVSVYAIIFFVSSSLKQVFLSVSMASHPEHFEFNVDDSLINCSIVVTVLYGVILLVTSLMAYWRKKNEAERGIEGRNLMSED